MALFKIPSISDALDRVLDQERQILLSGNIKALAQLAPHKERLFTQLSAAGPDPRVLENLRKKADRNQELLRAAAKGIRAVTRRLEMLRNQKSELRTYTAGGQSMNLAKRGNKVEKRA